MVFPAICKDFYCISLNTVVKFFQRPRNGKCIADYALAPFKYGHTGMITLAPQIVAGVVLAIWSKRLIRIDVEAEFMPGLETSLKHLLGNPLLTVVRGS